MAGVRDRGRDLGEAMGRLQGERRVQRVVEGVDRVVHRAGMIGVVLEQPERDGAGADVEALAQITGRRHRAQHGERVVRGHLRVVRILLVEALHRLHVADPALDVRALAPQDLHGVEKALLSVRRRFGAALRPRRREALQHAARLGGVHLGDQRVVVGERLAPVRHGEVRIDRLGGLELLDRLLPAEAVQDRHAAQEVVLRFPGRGGREVDRAHVVELCLGGHGGDRDE